MKKHWNCILNSTVAIKMELIPSISTKWNPKKGTCIPAQSSNFWEIMAWNHTSRQERSKLWLGGPTISWRLSLKILSYLISKGSNRWQFRWALLSSLDHPKISEVDLLPKCCNNFFPCLNYMLHKTESMFNFSRNLNHVFQDNNRLWSSWIKGSSKILITSYLKVTKK